MGFFSLSAERLIDEDRSKLEVNADDQRCNAVRGRYPLSKLNKMYDWLLSDTPLTAKSNGTSRTSTEPPEVPVETRLVPPTTLRAAAGSGRIAMSASNQRRRTTPFFA